MVHGHRFLFQYLYPDQLPRRQRAMAAIELNRKESSHNPTARFSSVDQTKAIRASPKERVRQTGRSGRQRQTNRAMVAATWTGHERTSSMTPVVAKTSNRPLHAVHHAAYRDSPKAQYSILATRNEQQVTLDPENVLLLN